MKAAAAIAAAALVILAALLVADLLHTRKTFPTATPDAAWPTPAPTIDRPLSRSRPVDAAPSDGPPRPNRFAGRTRRQWIDFYSALVDQEKAELARWKAVLDRSARGTAVDESELREARWRVPDIEAKIRADLRNLHDAEDNAP